MARKASRTSHERQSDSSGAANFVKGGFTIVELHIVIVVIAILAAITIVAYNGIQNQAKAAAAQAAAKQAATKIQTYAVRNADQYPADLAAAGLSNSGDTSYQYRVDNSATPKTYCITATTQNTSYYVSSSTGSPAVGACAGHGANGVAAITNLANNPGAEVNTASASSVGSNGTTIARDTTTRRSGTGSFRATANGSSAGFTTSVGLSGGTSFRWSAYVRSATATTINTYGQTYVSGTYTPVVVAGGDTTVSLPANTWTRVSWTGVSPHGASYVALGFLMSGGATVFIDDVMITTGTANYAFADGDSPGWIWNGASNASTSTGPPL